MIIDVDGRLGDYFFSIKLQIIYVRIATITDAKRGTGSKANSVQEGWGQGPLIQSTLTLLVNIKFVKNPVNSEIIVFHLLNLKFILTFLKPAN